METPTQPDLELQYDTPYMRDRIEVEYSSMLDFTFLENTEFSEKDGYSEIKEIFSDWVDGVIEDHKHNNKVYISSEYNDDHYYETYYLMYTRWETEDEYLNRIEIKKTKEERDFEYAFERFMAHSPEYKEKMVKAIIDRDDSVDYLKILNLETISI